MNQFWVRELPSGTCESGGGIPAPGQRGFTLLELMIVITIVGILIAVAVPSFQNLIAATRRGAAVSAISDAVATARAESVSRGIPLTLCASSNGVDCDTSNWEAGIVLVQAGAPVQVWGPASSGITIRGAAGYAGVGTLAFGIDGTVPNGGVFVVCEASGSADPGGIVVNVAGLLRAAIAGDAGFAC